MGADDSRRGLKYQDRYLLLRLLREIGGQLETQLAWEAQPAAAAAPTLFGIEARPALLDDPQGDGPTWDMVAQHSRERELVEAKSGKFPRSEHPAFWARLRREVVHAPDDVRVVPVLVIDPQRLEGLERWEGLAALAAHPTTLPDKRPSRVDDLHDLLDEALWHLCVEPPVAERLSLDDALAVLSRLRIDPHVAAELAAAVTRGVGVLFTNGLTEQIVGAILSWLDECATATAPSERFLGVRELLIQIRVFDYCASLAPGAMARWRELRHDLPLVFGTRVHARLGQGGLSLDAGRTQPAAVSAIAAVNAGGHLLLGQGGAGKTALLDQCARLARDAGAEIFCTPADALLDSAQLDALFDSLRFSRALLSLRSPERRFHLAVDGLDEVNDHALQLRWARHLEQFAVGDQTVVVATMREAVWDARQELRTHLGAFSLVRLDDWTEDLVREILAGSPTAVPVSAALLTLLRRPIFLDLFWRTFVEATDAADPWNAPPVETRYGLLNAFWHQRVLRSRRPRPPRFRGHLIDVLGRAALHIGSFDALSLDEETVAVLLSEGVLVPEGGLSFRSRFRHPLLRDYALAFWCLQAENAHGAATRWRSIEGGLQKQGALRAMFEALGDVHADTEHAQVDLTEMIAILASDPEAASSLARLLGTLERSPELDPGTWSAAVQGALPGSFGRELVAAARFEGNGSWASAILGWPPGATWLDGGFPAMLRDYTEVLYRRSNPNWLRGATASESGDSTLLSQARLAARMLRFIAVLEQFAAPFTENSRHLLSTAIELVMMLLPGEETLAWVESELPVATYPTRNAILGRLADLAGADPARAAVIYRRVIGLERVNGQVTLDQTRWGGPSVDYHAIDMALAGRAGRPSLVAAYPREFVPVVLDLVEALFTREHVLPPAPTLWSDLIGWHNFWNQDHHPLWQDRCLNALRHACGRILAEDRANFLCDAAPLLRTSRSTAVQSVYLDVLLEGADDPGCAAALRATLFDVRLYAAHWLLHWMEEILRRFWPALDPAERADVLGLIDAMAVDPAGSWRRAQLLATLPPQDLTDPRLQSLAAPNAADYHATAHPRERLAISIEGLTNSSDDLDADRIDTWPPEFDTHALHALSCGHRSLVDRDSPDAAFHEHLPPMVAAAESLIALLENHPDLMDDPRRDWMWGALAICMERSHFERLVIPTPSDDLVERCARLSMLVLERGAPRTDAPDTFDGHPWGINGPWQKALGLADAVLTWPPFRDDETWQRRFEDVWREALATDAPAVHVTVTQEVRPFHWLRNDARQRIEDELIWTPRRRSAVLLASMHRLGRMDDARRVRLLRRLLGRAPLGDAAHHLCERVGGWLGLSAMTVWPNGRRTAAVELIDEVVGSPERWELLRDPVCRGTFLRAFATEMQETASNHRQHASQLALDYGRWNLAVWRAARDAGAGTGEVQEDRDIAGLPLFWLPQHRPGMEQGATPSPADPVAMQTWWRELQPFCRNVAAAGHEDDVYYLLQDIRPGMMNHVLQAADLFGWLDILLDRLAAGVGAGTVSLDQPVAVKRQQNWRQVLQYAVNALDTLRLDNLLGQDRQRERAFGLLERLATAPFNVEGALHVLQLFRRDQL